MTTETHPSSTDASAARYTDLVYAAALRQTKDPHLAADITQAVFLVLLKKSQSGKAPEEHRMAGWLLQVTRYVVKETRRASWRRRRRELTTQPPLESSAHPTDITDLLDAALLSLSALDREIIARRYLHEEPVESLAVALGLSENTASKRIGRALDKLRAALFRQGITAPTAAISGVLLAQAAIKSPSAAAASPLAHALARRTLFHSLLVKTGITTAIAAVCCLLGAATVFVLSHPFTPTTPIATANPASTTTQPADEPLIHLGKILEPSSDKLVAQILTGIEQNRAKLQTVEIESTVTFAEAVGDDDTLYDGQITGKGWLQNGTPQQFRVEISLSRSPWIDGPKPYLDDSFTETWDGATLRILHQPPHSSLRAEVGEHEGYGEGEAIFGRGFSMQLPLSIGFGAGDREYKEDPLNLRMLKSSRLTAGRVTLNGHESLELDVRPRVFPTSKPNVREVYEHHVRRYWFDPLRGFALLANEEGLDNAPRMMDELVVDELAEPVPGVFYPLRAKSVAYSRDHRTNTWHLWLRSEFHATYIIGNQPLPPSLFHLTFPPGISISHRGPTTTSQPASQP